MADTNSPQWLEWAREIQALSQTGLTFTQNEYERERYRRLSGIAAEIVAGHTGLSQEGVQKDFLSQPGYATPKIDVRGAVVQENKILLVQERTDQRWSMPGGWADVGDRPAEMVAREVWEESGMHVIAKKVIGVYDANRTGRPMEFYHAFKIIFLCEITGGKLRSSNETLAADFFDFEKLPPLSLNRTNERHLAEVLAHVRDHTRPAAFD